MQQVGSATALSIVERTLLHGHEVVRDRCFAHCLHDGLAAQRVGPLDELATVVSQETGRRGRPQVARVARTLVKTG